MPMLLHARAFSDLRFHEVRQVVTIITTLIRQQKVPARLIPRRLVPHDLEFVAEMFSRACFDRDRVVKG